MDNNELLTRSTMINMKNRLIPSVCEEVRCNFINKNEMFLQQSRPVG